MKQWADSAKKTTGGGRAYLSVDHCCSNYLCWHVVRTGREKWWILLIIFVPLIGVLTYFFVELLPSLVVLVLFSVAFYCLSQVIKVIPLGIAYAIWAGVGIVLTALIGYFFFRQQLDGAAIIGIALIVSGVVVINLFSKSAGH